MSGARSLRVSANEVELAVQLVGSGSPVVLVHGSLDDHRAWARVVPHLTGSHRVVTYDRRGHGTSTCPPGQGRISEDAEDLAALILALRLDSPLVVGHSYGASTTLLMAAGHPELASGLLVHEPPLFALLRADPATRPLADEAGERLARVAALLETGALEEGVRSFVESAFGPGTWEGLFTPRIRETCIAHAHTWLDQSRDPERLAVRPDLLAGYPHQVTVSHGDTGSTAYASIAETIVAAIPRARRHLLPGAGHAPHLSHPRQFAALVLDCARDANPSTTQPASGDEAPDQRPRSRGTFLD